ncbi:MAG: hypothetical protein NTX99_08570, partial [Candidatus Aminicenantes bacterium]|nr:hypothetical protein [Candidatus Aminicenantes bacterium]
MDHRLSSKLAAGAALLFLTAGLALSQAGRGVASMGGESTIFVIFDDHILRIRLKNSEFVECKTNKFYISS